MRRLLPAVVAGTAVLLPGVAVAGWTATAGGSASVTALTMTGPAGFTAACPTRTSTVTLSWSPTDDEDVDHYVVTRTGSGGGANRTFTVPLRTSSSGQDTLALPSGQTVHTYTYVLRAAASGHPWTSPPLTAPVTISVRNNGCF